MFLDSPSNTIEATIEAHTRLVEVPESLSRTGSVLCQSKQAIEVTIEVRSLFD